MGPGAADVRDQSCASPGAGGGPAAGQGAVRCKRAAGPAEGTIAFTISHPAPLAHAQEPQFSPFLYALDLLIPIVGFGQRNAFNPMGWHHWLAAALIAAGWILATTIAAGITRVLSRQ